ARGPDIVPVPRRLAHSRTEFAAWLKKTFRALAPTAVVVDAFPLGILGELADPHVLPEAPLYHVARLLKWSAYRDAFAGTPRKYDTSFSVETLTPAHEEFLGSNSSRLDLMDLPYQYHSQNQNPFRENPVWLVVHSGSATEVHALLEFAAAQAKRENAKPHYVVV